MVSGSRGAVGGMAAQGASIQHGAFRRELWSGPGLLGIRVSTGMRAAAYIRPIGQAADRQRIRVTATSMMGYAALHAGYAGFTLGGDYTRGYFSCPKRRR